MRHLLFTLIVYFCNKNRMCKLQNYSIQYYGTWLLIWTHDYHARAYSIEIMSTDLILRHDIKNKEEWLGHSWKKIYIKKNIRKLKK